MMKQTELKRKTPLRSKVALRPGQSAKTRSREQRPKRQGAKPTRYSTLRSIGKRGKRLAAGDARARREARERAKGICQRCGKAGSDHHHWVRRAIESVRHHPWNQCYLCRECHAFLEANPEYQRDFMRAKLPPEQVEWIEKKRKGYRDDRVQS